MWKYIPALESSIFLIIIFSLNLLLLRRLLSHFNKSLNYKKNLKRFIALVFITSFFIFLGMSLKIELLLRIFVLINLFLIFSNLSFLVSLPFMLLYLQIVRVAAPKAKNQNNIVRVGASTYPLEDSLNASTYPLEDSLNASAYPLEDSLNASAYPQKASKENKLTRADFIKRGVAVFPVFAIAVSTKGVIEGFSPTKFRKINFKYENLPNDLDGLKIAHISDLHLGFFVRINDFKKIIKKLNTLNLDLILITGDFVDDYVILKEAIELVKSVKTKYGVFASIGNHEYFRGIKPVTKAFKEAKIPLLIDESTSININNSKLFIGGVDDPKKMAGDINTFLDKSLTKVLKKYKNEDFKIIMSHRPNILPIAAKNNIDLVLSGHTHGGQLGMNNRSIFESFYPKSYLWGKYQIDKTNLYTSSGAGHWFPFRIGCPTEVPIITISKKDK